jgi:hypothetical protein
MPISDELLDYLAEQFIVNGFAKKRWTLDQYIEVWLIQNG